MHTIESFSEVRYTAAAATISVPPARGDTINVSGVFTPQPAGVLHLLNVPPGLRKRHIWVAGGAFYQSDGNTDWFVVGKLRFRKRGTSVGEFLFTDCGPATYGACRARSPRELNRIKPDGTGSSQPSLQFREYRATVNQGRDNLDISCFSFDLNCDQVEYEIEKTYAELTGVTNSLYLLFGCKIVSL